MTEKRIVSSFFYQFFRKPLLLLQRRRARRQSRPPSLAWQKRRSTADIMCLDALSPRPRLRTPPSHRRPFIYLTAQRLKCRRPPHASAVPLVQQVKGSLRDKIGTGNNTTARKEKEENSKTTREEDSEQIVHNRFRINALLRLQPIHLFFAFHLLCMIIFGKNNSVQLKKQQKKKKVI